MFYLKHISKLVTFDCEESLFVLFTWFVADSCT